VLRRDGDDELVHHEVAGIRAAQIFVMAFPLAGKSDRAAAWSLLRLVQLARMEEEAARKVAAFSIPARPTREDRVRRRSCRCAGRLYRRPGHRSAGSASYLDLSIWPHRALHQSEPETVEAAALLE